MEEHRLIVLNITDLRNIVAEAMKEALQSFDSIEQSDELMTKTDIANYLGINPKNLMKGAPQAYYVPFDKPMITTTDGKKGWKRSVVIQHLARRDCDIKKAYEEWLERESSSVYREMSDIYSERADI